MASTPVPAPDPAPVPDTSDSSLGLARRIASLVAERRGADVVLLDVRPLVDYTDFFLVATGQSGRQNQAIAEHVVRTLKGERRLAISKSGLEGGSWICLDLGDVVVHVFDPETRARYDLELLWADAARVSPDAPPPAPPEPAKRRRVARRAAVEDADAANAPDSERPPEDGPEPESAAAPPGKPARPRRAKRADAPASPRATSRPPRRRRGA